MPLQATSGAASYDGFGGGVPFTPTYIEDVFSTWLYTGNGSTQTITNGIDLSTKGGLVWIKDRNTATGHQLYDTARGAGFVLFSNATTASTARSDGLTAFTTSGFNLGANTSSNQNTLNYASWTFRKQPKFFDVVTYTGNGTSQTINHNLGSVPGCIIVKNLDGQNNWRVYHRSLGATKNLQLNLTDAENTNSGVWNDTAPTSTQFTVGSNGNVNRSGEQHVAYLFAHDAGGFGLTGTDNVISCGSFTTPSSGDATITLGYEPQWLLVKRTNGSSDWYMVDTMRGLAQTFQARLDANLAAAEETTTSPWFKVTATGFTASAASIGGSTPFIYIAIRRGPMKTPTSGTSVFAPVTYTGTGATRSLTAGFPIDLALFKYRSGSSNSFEWFDRLRGTSPDLRSAYTFAELATTTEVTSFASNTQVSVGASSDTGGTNVSGYTYVLEAFQRAPGFFDVVCFTSTGSSTQAINHNLGVTPELIIEKVRNNTSDWAVQQIPADKYGSLNSTNAMSSWSSTGISAPTATVFSPSGFPSGRTEVAYLFASCPGVSKVGSYTGNGSSQTIDMGFTGGARFFLVKRTDSTGDWWVYDSARGIVAATDPALRLNSTAAEVTSADAVDTASVGLIVNQESTCNINVNGATYIYLGIA